MGYLILIIFLSFTFGYLLCKFIHEVKSSGEIVLYEDEMYLNISMKDVEKFKNNNVIMLTVKRRNFKGFNDGN